MFKREFNRYVGMVKDAQGFVASKKHLDKKIRDIQELKTYKLTDVLAPLTMLINCRPILPP